MASKGWSKRFDPPIVLKDGTTPRTLRDAIQYLGKTVPKAERDHPHVVFAAEHLARSAEQGYSLTMYLESNVTPSLLREMPLHIACTRGHLRLARE